MKRHFRHRELRDVLSLIYLHLSVITHVICFLLMDEYRFRPLKVYLLSVELMGC